MRKLLKHRKAMSPVIAAIILIAVTVAVSIAVAAWMGALTIGFMATEQLNILGCEFVGGTVEATYTTVGTDVAPKAITVTAPTVTADFTAALYDAAGTTLIDGPKDSIGDDATPDTVDFTAGIAASTTYTVKITFVDKTGDYVISDNGYPEGSGGPISAVATSIVISAVNTGSAKLVIADVKISGVSVADKVSGEGWTADGGVTVDAGKKVVLTVAYDWTAGKRYDVELITAKGNRFPYTATAPSY